MVFDYIKDITFKYPYLLGLLALIPILLVWYFARTVKRQPAMLVTTTRGLYNVSNWKTRIRHLPFLLRMLSLAMLIVVLARPQLISKETLSEGQGIDIVLCIDVSGSMLAEDFTPNRLDAAKEVAANFVDSRVSDRIAVVIFSGESFTLCPVTTNKAQIKSQIFDIHNGLLDDGTAIGSGLATSCDRLKSSDVKSKVVILLTDGENNGGLIDPQTAKEIAKSLKIKVYTIGVGTIGEAMMPMQTPLGIVREKQKVSIDEKLMTQIATETGGKYFRATDNASLKEIYADIDKLEKSKVEVTSFERYGERFLPFVVLAFVFLMLEIILRYGWLRKLP
jgi:Ca-activated chloride channel homolog